MVHDTAGCTSEARPPRSGAGLGASRPGGIASSRDHTAFPTWARWNGGSGRRYTLGVEEEAMLLDSANMQLRQCGDAVYSRLPGSMCEHTGLETHAAVLELRTGVYSVVAEAVDGLAALRTQLAATLAELGLCGACSGTYPLASTQETRISDAPRYRSLAESLRTLARRSVTMALHVHIGVPDPDDAVRLLNGLRETIPVLLALSANSPLCEGRDTGFASGRTAIFQAFPRTGTPRTFADYAEYVGAIDPLIGSGAIPDPSFLWWDVRLQPALGTVEVRVMDAQTDLEDTAALVALVQALAHMLLEEGPIAPSGPPEVLAENRFLAARDGVGAQLIDPRTGRLEPVGALTASTLASCRAHAEELGCAGELDLVGRLVVSNGAERQRRRLHKSGMPAVVAMLAEQFAALEPVGVLAARPRPPDRRRSSLGQSSAG
ncbi:MAG: YbdK family carboxylate-amine ligase [Solirubrobacteraceae bacterium]